MDFGGQNFSLHNLHRRSRQHFKGTRIQSRQPVNDQILSIFLSKWEGFDSDKNDIVFVGATNRQGDIDTAALRRFTTKIEIKEPNVKQLKQILKIHLEKFNTDNLSDEDWTSLASTCHRYKFTGNDVKLIVENSTTSRIDDFVDEISADKDRFHEELEGLQSKMDLVANKEIDRIEGSDKEADETSLPDSVSYADRMTEIRAELDRLKETSASVQLPDKDLKSIDIENLMTCVEKVNKMKKMSDGSAVHLLYS